jgi:hypothetical protein
MRKILFSSVLALGLFNISAGADSSNKEATSSSNTYYINAPKFVRPLVGRWSNEYRESTPQVGFAIAKTAEHNKNSAGMFQAEHLYRPIIIPFV